MRPRRRCSCDRQRVPRRRARVGGLCGFRGTVERVPAKYQKTGRCAAVQERCKNEKGDKMSTEFYCEEFPTEQNGKPVQTLKDLLEACPEDSFHFMTPVGYVDLTAQDAEQLRQGAAMPAHAGESGWEIPIPAEKLLQQELVTARKTENGQWYDTLELSKRIWQLESYSLENVCRNTFKFTPALHNAESDALTCGLLFREICSERIGSLKDALACE